MIKELTDINIDAEEGILLCRAIGVIMLYQRDKTPAEILEQLTSLGEPSIKEEIDLERTYEELASFLGIK